MMQLNHYSVFAKLMMPIIQDENVVKHPQNPVLIAK